MRFSWKRFVFYTLGLFILTFGIALTIQSQLGTSPFDAVLVGLFRTFGLTIGSWEIVLGFAMVLFNAIAIKRRPEYLALLTALITGMGIDFWLIVLGDILQPVSLISQSITLLFGMVFAGLGIAINLQADFAPNPMDRSMLVVSQLTGYSIAISRAIISVVLVVIALVFGGAIGIGTILIALFSGNIIKFFMPYVAKIDTMTENLSKSAS
ncbi:putative membrane protein YczE [Evansella vedderi]|uniref:Membrane protein YczE n=1 Tax=Evansella vedderi TaxID=38282 RepID=A0ABT9ZPB0_9BACI|nr:YitT family protein [Evansella vedderi]MDQ0253081.1 putative membrane protein YczE [Evansella vedderi]